MTLKKKNHVLDDVLMMSGYLNSIWTNITQGQSCETYNVLPKQILNLHKIT